MTKTQTRCWREWRFNTTIIVHIIGANSGQMFRELETFHWKALDRAIVQTQAARDYGYNVRVRFDTYAFANDHYEEFNAYEPS